MNAYQINIPNGIPIADFELKMIVASKLFEDGRVSSGQAAEIAGVSKRTFLELVGKYNVSIFGYDFKELEEDLNNAK